VGLLTQERQTKFKSPLPQKNAPPREPNTVRVWPCFFITSIYTECVEIRLPSPWPYPSTRGGIGKTAIPAPRIRRDLFWCSPDRKLAVNYATRRTRLPCYSRFPPINRARLGPLTQPDHGLIGTPTRGGPSDTWQQRIECCRLAYRGLVRAAEALCFRPPAGRRRGCVAQSPPLPRINAQTNSSCFARFCPL